MGFRANERYNGVINRGEMIESKQGTPGFEFLIDVEGEGSIFHTIWITKKNEEYSRKDLVTIGADPAKLGNAFYLENELPQAVSGMEIVFGTKEETYKGKTTVKVAWIGKPKAPASSSVYGSVASVFGGTAAPSKPPAAAPTDDDIPF